MTTPPDTPSRDSRGAERRRFQRHEMMASVHVRHAAVDYLLELGNVSRSGALVLLGSLPRPLWMTLGRKVELSLVALLDENDAAPSSYRDPLVLRGAIVRMHAGNKGFGMHFDLSDEETARSANRVADLIAIRPAAVPRP